MDYVDLGYYIAEYGGESMDTTNFLALSRRASEIVEELCMYRITPNNLSSYKEAIQERIKKAVCAQIEYLDANGGADMDNGIDLASAGLGKFSYTKASGVSGSTEQSIYAPRAIRILAPTGLLYRGGGCY